MNTAKLVNSALTGGGLIYPENLNVIIGNESKGYPKGYVLDANATLSLTGTNGTGNNNSNPTSNSKADQIVNDFNINKTTFVDQRNNYTYQSLDINQLFGDDKSTVSNIHIGGASSVENKYKYVPRSIGDVQLGDFSDSIGRNNIIVGESIANIGDFNILNSSPNGVQIIKINGNNNLCLQITQNKALDYLVKNKRLVISLKYALKELPNKNNKSVIVDDYDDYDEEFKVITDFTRINEKVIQVNDNSVKFLNKYDGVFIYMLFNNGNNVIGNGKYVFNENADQSIFAGRSLCSLGDKKIYGVSVFGVKNTVYNIGEFACGNNNISNTFVKDGNKITTLFSIGGNVNNSPSNCIEVTTHSNNDIVNKSSLYVYGVGGYNGANTSDNNTKSLQQVISDIETAVSLNSNGPWDVDITSEFVNGNVTIKPLLMWTISQTVKRVYFTADLKQGDVITIPDTLRMYIGWKISDNRFGMADWNTAGKKYTVTTDSNYVILVATANDNPGVQINNLPSFGKVMLRTSNPEFKPTAKTESKKDHTNDDKVMRGIAHQGFHKLERANSLAAFRAAAKEGWRYVETDTYMTKDGKFIVSHDDNIPVGYTNGTTTLTDTSYKYEQHTLDEILAFHGPNGEKVDTLEDFCKLCKECGLHPYIEIKQGNMWQANTIDTTNAKYNGKPYAIKLLDIVNRYGLRGNATFISSTPYTLRLMAQKDQSYRYGIVYFGNLKITDTNLTTLISKIEEFNNDADASKAYLFVDVNIDNLKTADVNIVNLFVSRNCALEVWTAKTKEDLDNLDPYVTGVTSDNIHAGEILAKKI